MSKNILHLLLLYCTLMISAAVAAENEMNSVLASVNGEAISLYDILPLCRKQEYQAYAAFSGKRLEQEIRNIRKQAVDSIIDRKLAVADYKKQSFRIASRDIEHEIDQAAAQYGCRSRQEFMRKLAEENIDFQKFRSDLEERMIYFYMIQRLNAIEGTPTPREIYEYFEANRKTLAKAETCKLAMLKLDSKHTAEKIQEVTQILTDNPAEFENLAKLYNPESNSGYLGDIEPSKLRVEFADVVKAPVVGKIYGPIKLDDGIAWIKLLEHNKAQDAAFQDVQSRIIKVLEAERRKKAVDLYIRKLRADAVLEYFF